MWVGSLDFTEFERTRGGTWRLAGVLDYATKLCLAMPISGTVAARDTCAGLEAAIAEAERLLGHRLADDCYDEQADALHPLAS